MTHGTCWTVWLDWVIYWTLGKFLKPLATINLPKSLTFLGKFVKVAKSIIFLVPSFLENFYRHLAIFFWSHCCWMSFDVIIFLYFLLWAAIKPLSFMQITNFPKTFCRHTPLIWVMIGLQAPLLSKCRQTAGHWSLWLSIAAVWPCHLGSLRRD